MAENEAPPSGSESSFGDVVSNIDVNAVGISEVEKDMVEFLTKVTQKAGKLEDVQGELNDSLEDFVRISERNFEREKKEATVVGKQIKQHQLLGKELVKRHMQKLKESKDPKVLKAMHQELVDWNTKKVSLDKQYDLQEAIRVGDKKRIYELKDEMGLLTKRDKMMASVKGHLGEEKGALQELIGVGKLLPLVLGGATIIEGLKSMVQASLSWKRELAEINQVVAMTPDLLKGTQAIMDDINLRSLGFSEADLAGVAKQMAQVKAFEGTGKKAAESLHMMGVETAKLSKATGMATSQAGELLTTFAFRYGTGVRSVRGLSAAFKSVTDTSRITADQLAEFMKSLEPIYLRLPNLSKEAKTKLTTDMMAIAGAIGDVFGDPHKISDMFSKMLDPLNEQGAIMLAQMTRFTGKMSSEIRESLKRGDMKTVYRDFSQALSRMSEDDLNRFYHQVGDVFGMSYEDLAKFSKQGKMTQKDWDALISKTEKARKDQEAYNKKVKDTTTEWDRNINTMKHAINKVWRVFGDVLLDLGKGPLKWVTDKVEAFGKWMQGPGKTVVAEWGKQLKNVLEIVWDLGKKGLKWLLEGEPSRLETALVSAGEAIKTMAKLIGDMVEGWDNMDETTKGFLTGAGPGLLEYLKFACGNLGSMIDLLDAAYEKFGLLMDLTGTGALFRAPKLFRGPELDVKLPQEQEDYEANRKAIYDAIKSAPEGVDLAAGVDKALRQLPRDQARKLAKEPEIKAIFDRAEAGEKAPPAAPAVPPSPGVTPSPGMNPSINVGGPNVNVSSDPGLVKTLTSLVPMLGVLVDIRDTLQRQKAEVPIGTAMALNSMGG